MSTLVAARNWSVSHYLAAGNTLVMGGDILAVLDILGEPASKANSRQLVRFGNRPASIKSKKARDYVDDLRRQVRPFPAVLEGELAAHIWIWYASRRPDLDESVILDGLQGLVYANDRQVRERHVYWGLDRANPRCRVVITRRGAI